MTSATRFAIVAAGHTFARNGDSRREIISAMKVSIIAAGLLAGWMFSASGGHASDDAPWCAVINLGMDTRWDCRYRTVEEWVPNVIGGEHGSCSPNPQGPAPATAVPVKRAHKHHVRHA